MAAAVSESDSPYIARDVQECCERFAGREEQGRDDGVGAILAGTRASSSSIFLVFIFRGEEKTIAETAAVG